MKEKTFFVQGMHCASCEILIEKQILAMSGVESVEASTNHGKVLVEYKDQRPTFEELNKIFKKEGYIFSESKQDVQPQAKKISQVDFLIILVTSFFIIGIFLVLNRLGLAGWLSVNTFSSLPVFFIFGLLAGISSCAALVGGLVLSMSKQWLDLYSENASLGKRLQPHLMFNSGRIVAYAAFGALLGVLGSRLQISTTITSTLVIIVSLLMVLLGLQMLGLRALRRFQPTMPKFITKYVANESNFKGRQMPFLMGAGTFFLPCGFTITVQGLALLSGDPLKGSLMMTLFALGTLPTLFLIGLSSISFSQKPHTAMRFLKIAAVLVLFFALFNINSQLNVLGLTSINDLGLQNQGKNVSSRGLPALVNGKQLIKMDAFASGYEPNYFKVKAGVPVRWEITDRDTSGCTNAVISKSLFDGQIGLRPGQVSVKEFVPQQPGRYKFSCWMGMVSGVIEVVDENGSLGTTNEIVNPGGSACSCGCGGEAIQR